MTDQSTSQTLIEDLEAIQKSLDKISKSKPSIPTLEEIVGHRAPTTVNPQNPFLSSNSLSELIKIRNEAESRTAEELATMEPVKTIEEILAEPEKGPDPDEIIELMEGMFDSWVENSVTQYLQVFESELRNRLQQDFRDLVTQWYKTHELPIPETFAARLKEDEMSNETATDGENPEPPSESPEES
jgi:hypothetical protein